MTFKQFRDGVQQLVYKLYHPFVQLLIRTGITPNVITTLGLIGNIVAAGMFVYAGLYPTPDDYTIVAWGGCVILFSSIFDMIDGHLARVANMCSTFGAFYDSVLDRYCELFTLSGLAFYFMSHDFAIGTIVTMLALIGSIMVSYVRARAEGLDLECKVGLMQRPERVVVTSVGAMLFGLSAYVSEWFNPMLILLFPQLLIALLANWTAIIRINHVRKSLD